MAKILVTGGCGYIGSHTVVDLLENGYEVIIIDDFSSSSPIRLDGIKAITGKAVKHYPYNLCEPELVEQVFAENTDLQGIIHFAAFMSVPESVEQPLKYFRNNLNSLINLLEAATKYKVPYFVFSSSCSVYGNTAVTQVTEETPMSEAQSPYARTKQMGEQIITDTVHTNPALKAVQLRYFNPVGAHPSAQLGELASFKPNNLVPIITQTAMGKRAKLTIAGNDYNTPDGTSIRDYIHVSDVAHAHTLALRFLENEKHDVNPEIFNLGTGKGSSVLEVIHAFEQATSMKLNFDIGPRRPGDLEAIYANKEKAEKVLDWKPKYSLQDMMATAWAWEQHLSKLGDAKPGAK